MDFIGFNRQIIEKKLLNFYLVERFRYADAFFETILFINGKFPLMKYHRERIYEADKLFNFENFEVNIAFLLDLIARNGGLDKTLRVRISFVRADGENYKPKGQKTNILIECLEINSVFKPIENISTYSEIKKQLTPFASIKTSNALIYVMAKRYALENKWNDVVICNQQNHWIEATSSNLFIVKNNKMYTSKNDSACVLGVSRAFIANHFEINYVNIDDDLLNDADEMFLTNGANLIQTVLFFKNQQLNTTIGNQLIIKTKKLLSI